MSSSVLRAVSSRIEKSGCDEIAFRHLRRPGCARSTILLSGTLHDSSTVDINAPAEFLPPVYPGPTAFAAQYRERKPESYPQPVDGRRTRPGLEAALPGRRQPGPGTPPWWPRALAGLSFAC